jgi:hypothetical protein
MHRPRPNSSRYIASWRNAFILTWLPKRRSAKHIPRVWPKSQLKIDAALARHSGHDLLAEMAIDVHIKLVERRGALNRLISEFRALVEQVIAPP